LEAGEKGRGGLEPKRTAAKNVSNPLYTLPLRIQLNPDTKYFKTTTSWEYDLCQAILYLRSIHKLRLVLKRPINNILFYNHADLEFGLRRKDTKSL
jgi:hypothetical protein